MSSHIETTPTRSVPDALAGDRGSQTSAGARSAQHPHARSLGHIPELDGLRGIAALMVFFHHACTTTVAGGAWPTGIALLRSVSGFGNSGVDIFFVLSGFLITSILLGDRRKPTYYRTFYWKRVLRIVPVYMVVLLYVVLTQPHNNIAVLCAIFFMANLSLLVHIPSVMPFWSLAIEEQFYLVWPSLVHRKSIDSLLRWCVAIAAATVVLRLIFAAFGHYNYFLTFLHCDGLAVGALLACLYLRDGVQGRTIRRVIRAAWVAGALLFVVSLLLPEQTLRELATLTAIRLTGTTLLSLGLVGTLVVFTGARAFAPLRGRVLVFFGLISYCFYLVHLYVILAYDHRWGSPAAPDWIAFLLRLAVVLAGSVLVATVSRYALELPVQRLRRYIAVLNRPAVKTQSEAIVR